MGYALQNHDTGIYVETCARCGMAFGMTNDFNNRRRADHVSFYCPSGHMNHYPGRTAEQKRIAELERQVAEARRTAESAATSRKWAEKSAHAARTKAGIAVAAKRKLIERVHAGVCPHCNRTFKQLADHMKAKHPRQRDEQA